MKLKFLLLGLILMASPLKAQDSIPAQPVSASSSTFSNTAYQGTNPWNVTGSTVYIAGFNVSLGSITISNISLSSSSANIGTVSGSTVTAYQGGDWEFSGLGLFDVTGSTVTALQGTTPWAISQSSSNSSITAFQGGAPWDVSGSSVYVDNLQSTQTVTFNNVSQPVNVTNGIDVSGSSVTIFTSNGSSLPVSATIVNFPPTQNVSFNGVSQPVTLTNGATVYQGTNPWDVNQSSSNSSVTAYQGGPWSASITNYPSTQTVSFNNISQPVNITSGVSGSSVTIFTSNGSSLPVVATIENFPVQVNVSGSTISVINSTSTPLNIVGNISGSTVTALQGTTPWTIAGSVGLNAGANNIGTVSGSTVTAYEGSPWTMTALQGTNPWNITGGTFSIVNTILPITASSTTASVTAYQGNPPWDVSGSAIYAQQLGPWNVGITTGTNQIGTVSGSTVTVLQGTTPWNVSGSSVTIFTSNGSSLPVNATISNFPASVNVSGSTIVVVNSTSTPLNIVGIISGSTVTAYQGGPWAISNSTFGALQAGNWNVGLNSGTNNIGTVSGSSVTIFTSNGSSLPVAATVSNFPLSQIVYQGNNPWNVVGGTFSIVNSTLPVVSSSATAGVTAYQGGAWNIGLNSGTNNIGTVSGSSVTIFTSNGSSLPVSATVSNFPTGFSVSGSTVVVINSTSTPLNIVGSISGSTVTAYQGGPWTAGINNFPSNQTVNVTSGSVTVNNIPSDQTVNVASGVVTVTNSSFSVSGSTVTSYEGGPWNINLNAGTNNIGTISGSSVTVVNSTSSPVNVTGSVNVSGSTVSVSNFPSQFSVNGSTVNIYNSTSTPINIYGPVIQGTTPWSTSLTSTSVSGSSVTIFTSNGSSLPVSATVANFPSLYPVTQVTNPWNVVGGTFSIVNSTLPIISSSMTANVTAYEGGIWDVGLNAGTNNIGTVSGSTVTDLQGTNPWNVTGSTIVALQGTTPWNVSGSTVISNQGIPSTITNAWPVELTNGVNVATVTSNGAILVSGISSTTLTGNPVPIAGINYSTAVEVPTVNTEISSHNYLYVADLPIQAALSRDNHYYVFSASVNFVNAGNDAFYFFNPSGSGIRDYINRIVLSNVNNAATEIVFTTYSNAVVSSSGTAASILSMNIGGGASAALSKAFISPSVTTTGTELFQADTAGGGNSIIYPMDDALILQPGNSLLFFGLPSANNTIGAISIFYSEAP